MPAPEPPAETQARAERTFAELRPDEVAALLAQCLKPEKPKRRSWQELLVEWLVEASVLVYVFGWLDRVLNHQIGFFGVDALAYGLMGAAVFFFGVAVWLERIRPLE